MRKGPNHPPALKAEIVEQIQSGVSIPALAKKYKMSQSNLHKWKKLANGSPVSKADGRLDLWTKNREAQLMQIIGQQAVEIAQLRAKLR